MAFDNTTSDMNAQRNFASQSIAPGSVVYDASGNKIGTVQDFDTQGHYLVVEKGWLFPKELYIPASAFGRVNNDGVYLNINKDEIQSRNWDTPPTTTQTAATSSAMQASDAYAPETAATGRGNVEYGDEMSVPVHKEELRAEKTPVEEGRVRIHKEVVEEPQSITIPVSHEEVRVERVPVEGASGENLGPDAFRNRDVEVPLRGEDVNVTKEAHVDEEVRLRKREVTERERYDDTVRRERVDVEGTDQGGASAYGQDTGLDEQQPYNP